MEMAALWGALGSAATIAVNAEALRSALRFRRLRDLDASAPEAYPRLSVIVAARDEEEHVRGSLESLLGQDYPDLEVVFVNDRSEDRTGAIAEEIASRDPRLVVEHVSALPDGWLGKTHALHRAVARSSGQLLLFTDGDVHFGPGTLRRAVRWAEAGLLDHFAVAPDVVPSGFWQEVAIAGFVTCFVLGTRAIDVRREGSKAYVGVGAFNLVRRSALDRTPGFPWLRMEVLDDVGLALMLKRSGARSDFALGLEDVRVDWYPSLRAMMRGLEKNLFGGFAQYRWTRVAAFVLLLAAVLPGPFVALLSAGGLVVKALGFAALAAFLANVAVLVARTRRRPLPLLLVPVGLVLVAFFLVRSAWLCSRRGGIVWRGTLYPLSALRAGLRVRGGR